MIYTRTVIDAYHNDDIDIQMLANNGVVGIIHKATQGLTMRDDKFLARRLQARAMRMLVGAYHFADGSDPIKQAEAFLNFVNPTSDELVALDWETNNSSQMTYEQACAFVQAVKNRLGRWPVIYGSNLLKEKITATDSVLFNCPLWLAQYANQPVLPRGWNDATLWQYTGDGQGPQNPKWFPGAGNQLDVNQFNGTISQLRNRWPF